jgi:cysteine-rich repeat protein
MSKVRCTLCSDQYLVDDRFLCEKCKVNIYYERLCYYLPGCSSLAIINGTLICLACTLPNFEFSIKIKKCMCQKGFDFSIVNDTCNPICGDGLKIPIEDCDDGNLANEDGCSALCKIETNYKC